MQWDTFAGASDLESLPLMKGDFMETQKSCVTYRMNWEIFKGLMWLNAWLLKLLLIWAQFVFLNQG